MNCQRIVYSYTKSAQFVSCYSPHIQSNSLKNHPSVFFSSRRKNWTKAARQRKLQISNYNLKYPVIINFTVFEHVIISDNIQNLKFYQGSSKNMNDNMMFCTKNKLLTQKNCTQGFIILNFLLVQTAVKLRNSLMYESCKLWYSLNYFNFVQVFVRIFEKAEEYIIQKIFPEYMDPVTSRGWEKMSLPNDFVFF